MANFLNTLLSGPVPVSLAWPINQDIAWKIRSLKCISSFNIGWGGKPLNSMDFIKKIELNVAKEAKFDFQPLLDGDVAYTFADPLALQNATGYTLEICGKESVARFVEWYQTSHTKKQNEKYLCSYHSTPFL